MTIILDPPPACLSVSKNNLIMVSVEDLARGARHLGAVLRPHNSTLL